MVCPRCIASVAEVLADLEIDTDEVRLGEVLLSAQLTKEKSQLLAQRLNELGFELLLDHKTKIIAKIKSILIESIHLSQDYPKVNYSTLLAEALHQDYATLSRLFSTHEGVTIEKFILSQKIERVKELLFYDEMTLSQIAITMHYSSVAHLSAQFKKETGMTPSQFKKNKQPGHVSRDQI
ncbi:AraC family transcriptional regulator [Reichenbachiella sp. 5M10]|uniref:helix-turn-helix domain-containing protein n=1 Tax=Reichenbachiella sp. 5M10 TaxID=1889772 RepID=UPI00210084D4|nr:AraC family transcriptional regulator [Reichenbachiella sp. 5M10]